MKLCQCARISCAGFAALISIPARAQIQDMGSKLGESMLLATLAILALALIASALRHWRAGRATAKRLAASEARFRAISEASPLGMAVFDASTREIIWSNERYGKLIKEGLDRALGGSAWLDMALSESSPVVSFTRDFERPDGRPASARVHTARVKGDSGEPMLVSLVEDASAHRLARRAAEASQRKFEFIFKLSPLPMAILDRRTGRIMEVNDAFCALFGQSEAQWRDKTLAGSGLMSDGFEVAVMWAEMVRANGLKRREAILKGADGAGLACELSASGMDWGDSPSFALCAVDLTEQRKAEAEVMALNMELEERARLRGEQLHLAKQDLLRQERLASLGALVAGVAHELNTPIGNGLTVATALSAKAKSLAGLAKSEKMRRQDLSAFINDAIDCSALIERNMAAAADFVSSFKQVSVDQMSSKRRVFDLAKCVRDNCAAMAPAMRKSKVELRLDLQEGVELDSYPGALGQSVVNLVNNALLHAFEEGQGGTVTVGARQEGSAAVVWVSDDGKGISQEDAPRIFDPFYSTKFGQGGSGLGLSIVYNLARDALGGKIELDETTRGARFTLRIPRRAP